MRKCLSVIAFITTVLLLFPVTSFATTATSKSGAQSSYNGKIASIKHNTAEKEERVAISVDNYSKNSLYRIFRLPGPERIVIDFTGIRAPMIQQIINVNSKLVKNIRYAQFTEGIARVVIDTKEYLDFTVEEQKSGVIIHLKSMNDKGQPAKDKEQGKKDDKDEGKAGDGLLNRGDSDRNDYFTEKDMNVNYFGKGSIDEVHIKVEKYNNYNVFTLSDPHRIVVDFNFDRISGFNDNYVLEVGSSLVKSIRYARFDKNTIRVVVDVSSPVKYKVEEGKDKLILKIDNPNFKNILYHNNGDRVYFTLAGAKLTEGGETLKKFYTGEYDASGKKYTLTFPSKLANLNSGVININDGLLESVEIIKNSGNSNTCIVFNAKDKFHYEVFTRTATNDTAITLLKPASKSDKLVVIDAGHGGTDPGATYKSVIEKDLNLDIAVRLNNLLKEKNINTYMMREDDSYVALYERAYIANTLNAALFLSIHNNALGDTSYGGTMTLCYPAKSNSNGFNGRAFAQIVQTNLVKKLGTIDRKVIDRPNLVVLKATKMPAALAEIAFITNEADRNKLLNAEFRQKAAEALCDAVIQALAELDKTSK